MGKYIALVLAAVLGSLIVGAAIYGWRMGSAQRDRLRHGPGFLVLLAPPDQTAVGLLDGQKVTVAPGGRRWLTLSHGKHRIEITAPEAAAYDVEVPDGRTRLALATRREQCFGLVDVTFAHYGDPGEPVGKPLFVQRETHTGLFSLGERPGVYFSRDDEPEKISLQTQGTYIRTTKTQYVYLLLTIDCALRDRGAILSSLALGPVP